MSTKRYYDDGCGMAHALELIGERWGVLIVRELLLGPRRFTDLRKGLPTISPNVLTQRLDELERSSIVTRRQLDTPTPAWVYELSDWGRELEPVLLAFGLWALRSPTLPADRPVSASSFILGLRSMFDPKLADGVKGTIAFRVHDETFRACISNGAIEVEKGTVRDANAFVTGNPNDLVAVIYRGRSLSDALRAGQISIQGDLPLVRTFLRAFRAPNQVTIGSTEKRRPLREATTIRGGAAASLKVARNHKQRRQRSRV